MLCWLCVQEHLGGPDLLNATRMFDSLDDLRDSFNNATVDWKERLDEERARWANRTTNSTYRRYGLKKLLKRDTRNTSDQSSDLMIQFMRLCDLLSAQEANNTTTLNRDYNFEQEDVEELKELCGFIRAIETSTTTRPNSLNASEKKTVQNASLSGIGRNQSPNNSDLFALRSETQFGERNRVLLCHGVCASTLILLYILVY